MDGISVATPLHVPVLWLSTAERISVIVEMNHPGVLVEVGDWRAFSSDVASPPGLGWYPGSIRPAARRGSAEYQSRAIDICDGCWLQVP